MLDLVPSWENCKTVAYSLLKLVYYSVNTVNSMLVYSKGTNIVVPKLYFEPWYAIQYTESCQLKYSLCATVQCSRFNKIQKDIMLNGNNAGKAIVN